MTKTVFVLAAGLIALVLTGCQPTTTSSPAPVPAEYQATYEALQSQLVAFTALPLGNVSAAPRSFRRAWRRQTATQCTPACSSRSF